MKLKLYLLMVAPVGKFLVRKEPSLINCTGSFESFKIRRLKTRALGNLAPPFLAYSEDML